MTASLATLSLIALFTSGCTAQKADTPKASTQKAGTPAGFTPTGGSQTRTIQDTQWGIPAVIVTMPAGWKFDGLMSHGETCVSTLPEERFAVESPDGNIEVQKYPQISYSYGNDPQLLRQNQQQGCLVTQFFKPEDFLTHVAAPALHAGAHMEVHPWPGGPNQAQDRATAQQQDRQASVGSASLHTEIASYKLSLEYMRGNIPTSLLFIAEFHCVYSHYALMNLQGVECTINHPFTVRAPTAQLQSLLDAPIIHAADTPEWNARSIQYIQQRFAAQNAAQTARINNDRQNQIDRHNAIMARQQAQYEAGMQRAQASSDARHSSDVAFANHLGDQNTYHDSTTGKSYKVSNQYNHTYIDSTGRTILQTDSAYAPGPDTIWQELQPHN